MAGGDEPSIADFKLYSFLYILKEIQEKTQSIVSAVPINQKWVVEFMRRIEELPKIKEYMSSSSYMKRPLNNPHSKFNN